MPCNLNETVFFYRTWQYIHNSLVDLSVEVHYLNTVVNEHYTKSSFYLTVHIATFFFKVVISLLVLLHYREMRSSDTRTLCVCVCGFFHFVLAYVVFHSRGEGITCKTIKIRRGDSTFWYEKFQFAELSRGKKKLKSKTLQSCFR